MLISNGLIYENGNGVMISKELKEGENQKINKSNDEDMYE